MYVYIYIYLLFTKYFYLSLLLSMKNRFSTIIITLKHNAYNSNTIFPISAYLKGLTLMGNILMPSLPVPELTRMSHLYLKHLTFMMYFIITRLFHIGSFTSLNSSEFFFLILQLAKMRQRDFEYFFSGLTA